MNNENSIRFTQKQHRLRSSAEKSDEWPHMRTQLIGGYGTNKHMGQAGFQAKNAFHIVLLHLGALVTRACIGRPFVDFKLAKQAVSRLARRGGR